MQNASLFIATPSYDGNVTSAYVMSLLGLQRLLMQTRISHDVCLHSDSHITRARNNIAGRFLRQPIYSHLLFIDADISFDPATVLRYLEFDKDVIGGIYPIKKLNIGVLRRLPIDDDRTAEAASYNYSSSLSIDEDTMPQNGFVRVKYAASGFMMIKRRALEAMASHYPELHYQDDFTEMGTKACYAFFNTMICEGHFLPEDYSFCKRWEDMGGEVWGDVASRFDHIGRFVYSGHIAAAALKALKPHS
jgi:heme exporter protein D